MNGVQMRSSIAIVSLILLSCASGQDSMGDDGYIQLFNGRDLTGWDIKISGYPLNDNYLNTFRVEDGVLKVSYDEYDRFDGEFGHIFFNQKFSEYILRVEYRFIGDQAPEGPGWAARNNGAMLHSQSAESMLLDQAFPVSIEAQFLGGLGENERPTMNVCTPGTHIVMDGQLVTRHCNNSNSKTYHGDDWITVEMIVQADRAIYHVIEGDTVLAYSKPQIGGDLPEGFPLAEGTPLMEGYIAFQAESSPIEFRKIELLDLSRK